MDDVHEWTSECLHLGVPLQWGSEGGYFCPLAPTSQCLAQLYGCISQHVWLHIFPVSKLAVRCCGLAGIEAPFSSPLVGWRVLEWKCTRVFCEEFWPASWPSPGDRWRKHLSTHPGPWQFFLASTPGQPRKYGKSTGWELGDLSQSTCSLMYMLCVCHSMSLNLSDLIYKMGTIISTSQGCSESWLGAGRGRPSRLSMFQA